MEKIVLQSVDKKDLTNDIKKYTNYIVGPIKKVGRFYKVELNKKP